MDDCYIPQPAEIAERCLEFQSRWTEPERIRRMTIGIGNRFFTGEEVQRGKEIEKYARERLACRGLQ